MLAIFEISPYIKLVFKNSCSGSFREILKETCMKECHPITGAFANCIFWWVLHWKSPKTFLSCCSNKCFVELDKYECFELIPVMNTLFELMVVELDTSLSMEQFIETWKAKGISILAGLNVFICRIARSTCIETDAIDWLCFTSAYASWYLRNRNARMFNSTFKALRSFAIVTPVCHK